MVATVHDLPASGGYAKVPDALRGVAHWLLWKSVLVPGDKKPRKLPYYTNGSVRRGAHGSPEDRALLSTFDTAYRIYLRGGYEGLGLSMLPEAGLVALDFDNCVTDGVVEPAVLEMVGLTYAELSPSGKGVRAFVRGACDNRKSLDVKPNVEFFHSKGFVTVTGRVLPECELTGSADTIADMPDSVKRLYETRFVGRLSTAAPATAASDAAIAAAGDDGFEEGLSTSSSTLHDLDLDKVKSLLDTLDPDKSYDSWLKAGMAVHHQTGGSDEGLNAWDAWSQKGTKYVSREDLAARWAGFGKVVEGRAPITARYLVRQAKEANARLPYEAAADWAVKLTEGLDEFTLREKLCPEVRRDLRLGELERDRLALVLQKRLAELGAKYRLPACRELVEKDKALMTASGGGKPAWLKNWVYVTNRDMFYKLDTEEWVTAQGFNAKYNREVPMMPSGDRPSAAQYALVDLRMPTATKAMYVPWLDARFTHEGTACVNTYRPSSVPEATEAGVPLIPAAEAARRLVLAHLELLCGGRREVISLFLSWMAHNVQYPGVRIRFAPLIKGVEGDGKSLLGTLMASVMGRLNVRDISPKVINTDFNGWAEGAALGVLEEIKLTGHNRHDVLNALKPLITNDTIAIHRKGVDEYNALNTQNYMAFTNHHDALPLTETDRRWWIIFTPFQQLSDLTVKVGDLSEYFARLHMAIVDYGPSLRRWLLDYQLAPGFNPNAPAPMTDEKRSMVVSGMSGPEELVRQLIERGGPGVCDMVLSTTSLKAMTEQLAFDSELEMPDAWELGRILGRLGFRRYAEKPTWWGKTMHRLWIRGEAVGMSGEKIRELLDGTLLAC